VGAYVLLKDFEHSSRERSDYANFVQAKADRWTPPFEFYPPQAPASGVPHSDESKPINEAGDLALERIHELPFSRVADAMVFLRIVPKICEEDGVTRDQVRVLQAMLGRPQTGYLTPIERVRAIQYAATNGSAKSQLVLAVMYAEGIGVQSDYARAFHWFSEADKQGSPEAKFAMSQYFSLGVQGVSDQDKAKAVVYQIDSALSGFHPTAEKLAGILQRMNRFGRYGYGGPPPGAGPIYATPPYGPPGTSPAGPPPGGYIAPAAYGPPPYTR
jgi:hypothetical protein